MKFNLRNFFAFGLMASIAFLTLSAIINYFIPTDAIANVNNWSLFGIPKEAWRNQLIGTIILVFLFGVLYLVKANFKPISEFKKIKLQNSNKEIWLAIIIVFLSFSISSLDFNFSMNTQNKSLNYSKNELDLITDDETVVTDSDKEESIGKQTLSEVSEEIGITIDEAYNCFKKNKIIHSGNDDQSMSDIADVNELSSIDIYDVLNGKDIELPKQELKTNVPEKGKSNFAAVAKDMNLATLAKVIIQQQPNAKISKESISERLRDNNIIIDNNFSTIGEIAKQNKVSIDDILKIISTGKLNKKSRTGKLDGPPDFIKNQKDKPNTKKISQMPLSEIAIKYNLKAIEMVNILKENNIVATVNQSVEQIAKNNNQKPANIFEIIKSLKKE